MKALLDDDSAMLTGHGWSDLGHLARVFALVEPRTSQFLSVWNTHLASRRWASCGRALRSR